MASPAYIVLQEPAYATVTEKSASRLRRSRAAKPKKHDQPMPDGKTLQRREEEARQWATAHDVSAPTSLASAVRMYAEAGADKKNLRIFLAMNLIEAAALCMRDADKHRLLLDLKKALLLAGVPRVSNDNAALMLAFSQRLGIDKEAVRKQCK